jgi:hypothetical protein
MHGPINVKSPNNISKWQMGFNSAFKGLRYTELQFCLLLYGFETWSLTLREERRLRVFENRVLRRIFGPKRDEVTGNGENYIMRSVIIVLLAEYRSGNESRRMRLAGHVARMGERRGVCRVLLGNPEGKNHLQDPEINGRIILRWISRKWHVGPWTGLMLLR